MKNFLIVPLIVFLFSLSTVFARDLDWQTHVFPDGFTLVTKEVHSFPVTSVHLFVRVGSVDENPQINGISHLYEHMFFKGTPTRSATEMKAYIEDYGGDINGETYRDYTEFIANIPAIYTDHAVDYIMDGFLHASLEQTSLDSERKVVLDEVSLDIAEPERQLADLFQKDMYAIHPYQMPIEGNPASVKRITRDDLLRWKKTYYVPSNATLVVVGDIDTDAVVKQVGEILENVPAVSYSLPIFPREPDKIKPIIDIQDQNVEQAYMIIGYKVAGLDTPDDIYPTDVLTFMLGYGRSSMLTKELKDKDGLVDEASADFLTEPYPGTLQLELVCKPKDVDAAKAALLAIIDKIKKGEISQKDIDRAKTLLTGVYDLGDITDDGKADTIGFYAVMGNGEFCKHYLYNISKVTVQDIQRIANKYLNDNYVEAVYLPKNQPKSTGTTTTGSTTAISASIRGESK